MSRTTDRFINIAIKIAEAHPNEKHKHVAILVRSGNVLAIGLNTEHPYPHSKHAEVQAFRNPDHKELKNAVLYLARMTPGGVVASSKPCQTCAVFLMDETNVKKVYYTLTEKTYGIWRI